MSSLAAIGRQRFVSQSALAAILTDVKKHGVPESTSRSAIKRSRDSELEECTNQFGPLMVHINFPCVDSKGKALPDLKLPFVNPLTFLQHCLQNCPAMQRYYQEYLATFGDSPGSPLEIIAYIDEVSPGNQLRHDSTRKCQVIYWAFKQGPGLGIDQLWFTLGLARSQSVSTIKGGVSAYMRKALRLFLDPVDVRLGVQLLVGDQVQIKFMKFGMVIADEAALKETFSFKGAAGIFPCPLCTNIVSEASELHLYEPSLEPATSTDVARWRPADNEAIRAKIRRLAASKGNITRQAFEELEKSLGWVYNPDGVLADGAENPLGIGVADVLQYDWMHTLLVNGCWNIEMKGLLAALKTCGHTQQDLHTYLNELTWPSNQTTHAMTGRNIFRKKQEGNVSCSASEGLGVYACIRAFLYQKWSTLGPVRAQADSYVALCNLLDTLAWVRRSKKEASALATCVHAYVTAHRMAYQSELWVPKYHYLQHIPTMIMSHGVVVACFVHERKHRVAKRYAENVRKVGVTFEESVLKDILHVNMRDLGDREMDQLHIGLVRPVVAHPRLAGLMQSAMEDEGPVFYAKQAHYAMGCLGSVDDFVFLESEGGKFLGKVLFFVSVGVLNLVCVSLWDAKGDNMFEQSEREAIFDLLCIQDCVIHKVVTRRRVYAVPNSMWL